MYSLMSWRTIDNEDRHCGARGRRGRMPWSIRQSQVLVLCVGGWELAKRQCFFCERRKCPGTGAHRGRAPRCRGTPGRQSCMIQKKFWWAKKVGAPTIPASSWVEEGIERSPKAINVLSCSLICIAVSNTSNPRKSIDIALWENAL
jgi:hypothetical protein